MMNDEKQRVVPVSPQESILELEEQALEGVTGGTGFKDLIIRCIACGAPKAEGNYPRDEHPLITNQATTGQHVLTINKQPGVNNKQMMEQAQRTADLLTRNQGVLHEVVQQKGKITIVHH